jgi:pimeloyl-ACP methyl ester carboxylesterase
VARWAVPPSEFIDLDGQLVHLRDVGPRGDGLPLVLLHGTSASLHTWEGWEPRAAGQHPRDQRRPAGLRSHRPVEWALRIMVVTAAMTLRASCSRCSITCT